MVSSCVCFSLSLTLLDTDVDCSKNSFPSQSAFVAYAFIIVTYSFLTSWLRDPSGSRASAVMTEKGSWPWHPEQKSTTSHPEFSQSSSFFFPAPSPTLSYHLKPEYFSPYAGVKQIHQNTQTQTSHIAKAHYRLKQRQQIKGTPQQVNFLD